MARSTNGIPGMFEGRIGPVTGYQRNGINVIRIASRKKDNVRTPARLAQREKMRLCNEFTQAFTGTAFFKRTFPPYGHTGTGLHRATSALMNLAIEGTYPDLSLHYPAILVSKGVLPPPVNAVAARNPDRDIQFEWSDNSSTGTADATDQCLMVAYCPEMRQVLFSIGDAVRTQGSATLAVHNRLPGPVHTWIGFLDRDEKHASDSRYCGLL